MYDFDEREGMSAREYNLREAEADRIADTEPCEECGEPMVAVEHERYGADADGNRSVPLTLYACKNGHEREVTG